MSKQPYVQKQAISDTLRLNYMPYAMSVIVSRAIPEIDGFKPSHRKILYTMYRMGLLSGNRAKSADIVGQTMALNPHGDQAIYETMVRLTRGNGSLIHPWIDSKGNFGKVYSSEMQYAAPRYTEARLDASAELIFAGLNKDAVDMIDNYSGTLKEPALLPAQFPTILVNSNQGIAVGMASNICSFNLAEVCQATVALLANEEADPIEFMPAPDFSTGGKILYDLAQMQSIYESGRGSFQMSSVYQIDRKGCRIEITEIPYSTTIDAIMNDIAAAVESGKIKEIVDVRDETDLGGLKLTIDYRKSADVSLLIQKLNRFTAMTTSFSCNFNIMLNGAPQVLGVKPILQAWIEWRLSTFKRELAYEIAEKERKLHLLNGLFAVMLDIDMAIKLIRETPKESEVVARLMTGFDLDQTQAEYVAEIKLRHLNREYILSRTNDREKLETELQQLQALLGSHANLKKAISNQLKDISKKYGRERLSELVSVTEIKTLSQDDLIEDYRAKIFLTREGYVKKIALTSLRSAGDLKLKEDDEIVQVLEVSNKDEILFFTNQSQLYKMRIHELPDHKPSDFGEFTPNLLSLDQGEKVQTAIIPNQYEGTLVLAFADGRMVRFPLAVYATKQNRRKLVKAFYGGADLVAVYLCDDEMAEFALFCSQNRALVVKLGQVPLKTTRSSQGAIIMRLKRNAKVQRCIEVACLANENLKGYATTKIPAAGKLWQGSDVKRQLSLDDLS